MTEDGTESAAGTEQQQDAPKLEAEADAASADAPIAEEAKPAEDESAAASGSPADAAAGAAEVAEGAEAGSTGVTPEAGSAPEGAPAEVAQGAAGDQAGGQAPAEAEAKPEPRPPPAVHSARSVFRQREQKEYDPFTSHMERRITKLFEALDVEGTGRVDVQELGTLVRSVGCCPSETELQEMVTQLEEEGQPGLIRLDTVMPYIIQLVEDRKYQSATTEQLLQAFQVLADDMAAAEEQRPGPQKKKEKEEEPGTLPQDKLVHILTEEGEHLSQEEVEEMLSVVPASESGRVNFREFVKQLVVPELW